MIRALFPLRERVSGIHDEVNTGVTLYTSMSHHQNTGHINIVKSADISFENMAQFKYLGTTATNLISLLYKQRRAGWGHNEPKSYAHSSHTRFLLFSAERSVCPSPPEKSED
jgi:hypothetical protein